MTRPGGLFFFRLLTLLIAMAAALFSAQRTIRWSAPGIVYVSPDGAFLSDGRSPATAFRTIQRALDQAQPGDTIRVMDGVYFERLHVRRGGAVREPVIIEAANPRGAVISWECPLTDAVSGPWSDEGGDIFSAPTAWPIYRIHAGDATLYREPFGGIRKLRLLISRDHAWNSYCYEDGRVYVWLSEGTRAGLAAITTHRRVPEPREWGEFRSANITVEASHVELRGLSFRFGIGAGILLRNADFVDVSNSAFCGATYGVLTVPGNSSNLHLGLHQCLYHNYPQYHWRQGWLSWDEVYAGYSSSSLLATNVDHVTVNQCCVVHFGDGLRVSNKGDNEDSEAILSENLIALGTDDAFEIEGPARNVRIHHNLVYECHESLGLSPVEIGPVTVEGNLFVHRQDGLNGAQVKLINRKSAKENIRNVLLQENLFVGNWLCWSAGSVNDVRVTRNSFVVNRRAEPAWPAGVVEVGNDYFERSNIRLAANPSSISDSEAEIAAGIQVACKQNSALASLSDLLRNSAGPDWWAGDKHPATLSVIRDLARIGTLTEQ